MTTIEKMSWSLKNKPIKYYSLVTFLAFLFLMTIFKFKDEKGDRRTCENLKKLETLSDIASNVGACDILERIYSINVYATPIIIPDQLWVKVRSWLQEDEELLKTATNQNVIHITNKISGETTHYNPLRAKRPGSKVVQDKECVHKLISESQEGCDFCKYSNLTAKEEWGRVETPHCVTAANMFRLSGPSNGLIIARKHSVLELNDDDFAGQLECARLWFEAVREQDPSLEAGMMIGDSLGKSGASQIHPHMQTWMAKQFEGQFASFYRQADQYRDQYRSDYWRDIARLYRSLGLGFSVGGVSVMAPLTSHKEHEVMVVSDKMDADFIKVWTAIMRMYNIKLELWCRSLGMSWPMSGGRPFILRVGSRGACHSPVSDVSSLEMYSVYSVNTDPVTTIDTLKAVLEEME